MKSEISYYAEILLLIFTVAIIGMIVFGTDSVHMGLKISATLSFIGYGALKYSRINQ